MAERQQRRRVAKTGGEQEDYAETVNARNKICKPVAWTGIFSAYPNIIFALTLRDVWRHRFAQLSSNFECQFLESFGTNKHALPHLTVENLVLLSLSLLNNTIKRFSLFIKSATRLYFGVG